MGTLLAQRQSQIQHKRKVFGSPDNAYIIDHKRVFRVVPISDTFRGFQDSRINLRFADSRIPGFMIPEFNAALDVLVC